MDSPNRMRAQRNQQSARDVSWKIIDAEDGAHMCRERSRIFMNANLC